jgi:serine/threonine protein kinase
METQTSKINSTPISKYQKIKFKPNDLVLNKYQIINQLGTGGMSSIVYKAIDTLISEANFLISGTKYVAVKVINRDES